MKKIIVEEFNGHLIFNVSLIDENGKEISSQNNLNQDVSESYILHLNSVYKLPYETIMIDRIYNGKNELVNEYEMELGKYLTL